MPSNAKRTCPIVWTVSASDSAAHAGAQADIKALQTLSVHGATIITAVTAQNSQQVKAIYPVPLEQVLAQYQALRDDLLPQAIKIGLIPHETLFEALFPLLAELSVPIICDPVRVSTTGQQLSDDDQRAVLLTHASQIDLLTPNIPEAAYLSGISIHNEADMVAAAIALHKKGFQRVLLKGGHLEKSSGQPERVLCHCRPAAQQSIEASEKTSRHCEPKARQSTGEGESVISDYYFDADRTFWLTTDKICHDNTRGTGCTLSSAIAGFIAKGSAIEDAVVLAKGYIQQGLRQSIQLGQGPGPIEHTPLPIDAVNLPIVTDQPFSQHPIMHFPEHPTDQMGLYAVVDNLAELERMIRLKIPIVQLRIKDQPQANIEQQVQTAVTLVRSTQTKLYINDYWRLACQHQAYGVHLGQEDLDTADLPYIAEQGLRLGISTHCEYELRRAQAFNPSYIALGPIFPTNSKIMRFGPQGLDRLRAWRRYVQGPLVAIGGIDFDNMDQVWAVGVDSIAMISGLREVDDQIITPYGS